MDSDPARIPSSAAAGGIPHLLVISSDPELVGSLGRCAYQANCLVSTAPSLSHGWQMLKERTFTAVAIDCPDVRTGVLEAITVLKRQAPHSQVGLIIGWWDVNSAEVRGAADFILYKPLGRRQAATTLRRLHAACTPAADQRPEHVSTPAR